MLTLSRTIAIASLMGIAALAHPAPFAVKVVDAETSRGIPLVQLETILGTRYYTDSNGIAVIEDPLAFNRDIFMTPTSHGYVYKAPPLAMGGFAAKIMPDTSATIAMQREMIAERLYRITGPGIYKDSEALGMKPPIKSPDWNGSVVGQDSALVTPYMGKLLWVWGDTTNSRHPLAGNFRTTCAWSDLPGGGGLDPAVGIDLRYITEGNFTKPMMPKRSGGSNSQVYWLTCLMTAQDAEKKDHVLAWWNRIENPNMKTIERGIVEFSAANSEFQDVADYPTTAALQPGGHAVKVDNHFLFNDYGKFTRVKATYEAAKDPANYEALTCLENDGPFTTAGARVRRDGEGRVVYSWRKGVAPTGFKEQMALVDAGLMKLDECIYRPVNAATGEMFIPHSCSMAWNPQRKRWIMITSELMGKSMLGEVWYLESDRPEGPWIKGVKVASHNHYTLYNPLQHPELITSGSINERFVYFEGTYTKSFSGNEVPTPYYEYNQVMFRVALDDKRLEPAHSAPNVRAVILN